MEYSGITLTPGFIISAATDPQFNYVTALLHGDGTNTGQNNTFLDSSPNNLTVTRSGSTTQGTFTPFGTLWSNYLNGSSYLQTQAFNVACTGDFTFECWAYIVTYGSTSAFFTIGNEAAGRYYFALTGSGGQLWSNQYGGGNFTWGTATSVPLNQWTHIAWVRVGTTVTGYVNGISVGTQTISGTVGNSGGITIGANPAGGYLWTGYLSNVRIINGTALYTSTFTPSTTPLTAITNTSLLTCQSNRFKDNSTNNLTITRTGTPSVQVFSPFGTTTQYDPATIGGSGYFNGSTDYLTAPTGTAFQFAGDFTMEAWVYSLSATGQANYSCIFDTRATNTSSTTGIVVNFTPSGYLNFYINGSNYTSATLLGANNWTHVALVRSGSTISMYQNGVSVASVSYATSLSSGYFWAGALAGPAASGYWQGYISNLRVVNGTAVYTTTFTPPTIPLPSIGNTSLLLSGTNGQIYDNGMMNNLITVGSAQVSTSIFKYGTGSIFFNGSGSYLKFRVNDPSLTFGSGDFTIEGWVYLTSTSGNQYFVVGTCDNSTVAGSSFDFGLVGSANANIYIGASAYQAAAPAPTLNTWCHVAYVRFGTSFKTYLNGTQVGSVTLPANGVINAGTTNPGAIGANGVGTAPMFGYLDEFRITKGIARYTANFTPPTSLFPSTGPIPITTPNVEYLVVAGGGGGGAAAGGGGGAGGFRTAAGFAVSTNTSYTVTVGGGGAGSTSASSLGTIGNNSVFSTITSIGGGGGQSNQNQTIVAGGSGGGSAGTGTAVAGPGTGTAGQGNNGGTRVVAGSAFGSGGGGGASAVGGTGNGSVGGAGGAGSSSSITGTATTYAGGGGGGTYQGNGTVGAGGAGGGGAATATTGVAGSTNTGGGGGGGGTQDASVGAGGLGGSGIVILRYSSGYTLATSTTGNPTVTTTGGYNIYTWTSSGSITF